MSDCCSIKTTAHKSDVCDKQQHQKAPKKHTCPSDNKAYGEVAYKTLLHHVKKPWALALKPQAYYFCDSSECDVVYFGLDNTVIRKDELRTKVGVKEAVEDALICYCFDVLKSQARENSKIKAFVTEQTKNGTCSCSILNPSGKCCLKDFPK